MIDLGRLAYDPALDAQREHHAAVLAGRETDGPELGRVLLVEHDPVVTVTRRPGVASHVLASESLLAARGVQLRETDRGGDVTFHGPGQVVCYPIVDLNRVGLRLHPYMRLLEQAVIDTLAEYGLTGIRDETATGVWIPDDDGTPHRKIAAMGVRVRKWVTLHGLALNVTTDPSYFGLIVPCGLAGRPITTMAAELPQPPSFDVVRDAIAASLVRLLAEAADAKAAVR